jgi:hypothetical protein
VARDVRTPPARSPPSLRRSSSCAPSGHGAYRECRRSSPTPTNASGPRSARYCSARAGRAAGCTSCATCSPGPQGLAELVAAAIRTIFAQPQADMVRKQLGVIAGMLVRQFPKAEARLRDAAPEVLAFADWSTNPLERLNKEILVRLLPIPSKPGLRDQAACWRGAVAPAWCGRPAGHSAGPAHRRGRRPDSVRSVCWSTRPPASR